jgi:hypothetical protein
MIIWIGIVFVFGVYKNNLAILFLFYIIGMDNQPEKYLVFKIRKDLGYYAVLNLLTYKDGLHF